MPESRPRGFRRRDSPPDSSIGPLHCTPCERASPRLLWVKVSSSALQRRRTQSAQPSAVVSIASLVFMESFSRTIEEKCGVAKQFHFILLELTICVSVLNAPWNTLAFEFVLYRLHARTPRFLLLTRYCSSPALSGKEPRYFILARRRAREAPRVRKPTCSGGLNAACS